MKHKETQSSEKEERRRRGEGDSRGVEGLQLFAGGCHVLTRTSSSNTVIPLLKARGRDVPLPASRWH